MKAGAGSAFGAPIHIAVGSPLPCTVSIIIKALNEEKRISATIESALRAVSEVGGEVILADSHSTDRTIELAERHPIRVVQLANPEERCCGVGPQLGYQHSRGQFVYILDGDMEMQCGFLSQAIEFMVQHPEVAGVGGRTVEQNTESLEYISRGERVLDHMKPGEVDRLDGGALYRRSAIEASGYFSDRNLHSYEEFDLALRLRALGWRLWRLPIDTAKHYGHDAPPYQLLMRRWKTGYIMGLGELVRAAAGQRQLRTVLLGVKELRLYLGVLAWWLLLLSVPFWSTTVLLRLAVFSVLLTAPLCLMTWRKRSLYKALYAIVSWCVNTAGLVRGFLRAQRPAAATIDSRIIKEPAVISLRPSQEVPLTSPTLVDRRQA
jgi:glycosyltransferase involved in cell wall biosynthesis